MRLRFMSETRGSSELWLAVSWCSEQVGRGFLVSTFSWDHMSREACLQRLYLSSPPPRCRAWRSEGRCSFPAHRASRDDSRTPDLREDSRWTQSRWFVVDLRRVPLTTGERRAQVRLLTRCTFALREAHQVRLSSQQTWMMQLAHRTLKTAGLLRCVAPACSFNDTAHVLQRSYEYFNCI